MNTLLTLITVFSLWPLATGPQPDDWTIGQYKVESSYDRAGDRRFTILKDGKELYSERAGQFWFVDVAHGKETGTSHDPKPTDITGDGIPDLVVEEFPLHVECCWSYSIFSLGPNFKLEAKVEGLHSPMTFEDVNHDGVYELVGDDPTFYSWYASPRVVLKYDKAQATYEFATNLMKKAPPTEAQMVEKQKEFAKATVYAGFPVAPQIYGYMLDLIYSGNASSAWTFLNLAWPKQQTDKKEFIDEIMQQLKKSPYWKELQEMNRFPA